MSVLRLGLCVLGVYSMFLLWAVAQERLSVPFQYIDGQSTDKFKSALFLGTCQSFLSSLSALAYIVIRGKSGSSLSSLLGLNIASLTQANGSSNAKTNGSSNTKVSGHAHSSPTSKVLLLRYLQISAFITVAAPFGFAALSYITYPTMVLGKSCKLVPVMLMNFVMYRRRFAPHKYVVVAMVTAGISVFMGFGNEQPSKASSNGEQGSHGQLIGVLYLVINLILDGAVNSTQDEVFVRYKVTGQQMMLWINLFCTLLSTALGTLPLPHIPVLHPSSSSQSEFANAIGFIRTHPSVIGPLVQFSLTGALGQLFIFETLQHFGSLTLVMITLTRKMFTMVLSVVVYDHKLTFGQWAGAGIVFGGISVEAWVKRKEIHAKRLLQEKEKAKIKSL
ncbi:UDP-galactose transporter [Suillus clintonianus]|uniref:UDP-galactose transporter n=1 Tax=Suillus clintonianus TaxID=1904413 RepID=UPI001B86613D|nr:UDP-galactose transporter [Suillus clintonianus]KAG2145896.1 UDP-galactose transporter [Suillus clintonianus]